MEKHEFIMHCVLEREMQPETAMALWKQTQKVLWDDWKPDMSSPGDFIQGLIGQLDSTSSGARRVFMEILNERYNAVTGDKRKPR